MAASTLSRIVNHCERLLNPDAFVDSARAFNGLQVENSGRVTRIAAAVDATPSTVELAAAAGANLLIVHHGLFWNARHPWTGHQYRLLRVLLDNDLAVYSSHLPLDAHPVLGNNAGLAKALRLSRAHPFFKHHEHQIGVQVTAQLDRRELYDRLERVLGRAPILAEGGPKVCRRIGIVTGAAGDQLDQAAGEGVDTFITGEGPHWSYARAEELGINVFYGGHYATETFGVKALSDHLSKKFRIPSIFIEYPTGL